MNKKKKNLDFIINKINYILPDKYNIYKLNSIFCGIKTNEYEMKPICNWEIYNDKCSILLLYKDISNGDIIFISLEIYYCIKINQIIRSQIVFHLNTKQKIIILDINSNVEKLNKLIKILDLTIPYQNKWHNEYVNILNNLNHNFMLFDKDNNNFNFIDNNHESKHFVKNNKIKKPNYKCLTLNSIINTNNKKYIIKKPKSFENFVDVNYKSNMSELNDNNLISEEDSSCNWDHMAACLPKDYNYELPTDYQQSKYPVPESCKKYKLDNDKVSLLKKENSNHEYIYIDGRKFLVDKGDMEHCYTAAYWLKPELRNNCNTNYDSKINLSKQNVIKIDEGCFREIPTESGFNTSKTVPLNESNTKKQLKALDCNKAIRPSQKTEATRLITREANKWTNRSKKNLMLYNTKSALAGSKYNEIDKIGKYMVNHIQSHNSNENKIQSIKNSILSKQRQVEISNDETLKINTRIYFLYLLMIYLFIIVIIYILKRFYSSIFSDIVILVIIIICSLIFGIIIFSNLYSMQNRHPDRWNLRQWKSGILPEENDEFPKHKPQKTIHYPNVEEEHHIYPTDTHIPSRTYKTKYKCLPIQENDIDTEETGNWEENLSELNNELNKCNDENNKWVIKRNKLKNKICKAKGYPSEKCKQYFKDKKYN